MQRQWNDRVAVLAIFALLAATTPGLALAGTDARIEGLVVGVDGTPAAGYTVHLIEPDGSTARTAETDADGVYTFAGLDEGEYALGLQGPDGTAAAVDAPPVAVAGNQLARRDMRLYQTQAGAPMNFSGGLGLWWAGLSAGAKAGTIIALLAIVGYGASEVLDDDEEDQASPMEMVTR